MRHLRGRYPNRAVLQEAKKSSHHPMCSRYVTHRSGRYTNGIPSTTRGRFNSDRGANYDSGDVVVLLTQPVCALCASLLHIVVILQDTMVSPVFSRNPVR